ncbi:hypothetical protein D3C79_1047180 [compost metagenome]
MLPIDSMMPVNMESSSRTGLRVALAANYTPGAGFGTAVTRQSSPIARISVICKWGAWLIFSSGQSSNGRALEPRMRPATKI